MSRRRVAEGLESDLRNHLESTLSGAYTIERELGGGGMSRVFLAEERALGRRVVVKVLSPDLAAGVNVERFKREILLTASLQHPHIVPVLTAGALNPESSKGFGLRGAIRHTRADPNGAARDYKQALVLDPNDPEALLWLGYHYAVSGRPALARALIDRLQQVDPLTSLNLAMYGMVEMFDGNYPEALTWTQRAVDIDPANPTPRMLHAMMLAANGRRDEGVAILDAVARDGSAMAWARLAPAMACALRGERDGLLLALTPELRAAAHWDEIFAWWTADCLALVNERDEALDFLERAVEFGVINWPWLSRHEPFLANVRDEERFSRLMERVRRGWEAFEP